MAVGTYTKAGNKAATPAKLDKNIFVVEVKNHELLKEAYVAYLANGRQNLAKTKKRGEVRGGGQKPWRQKGTGRARFGSSRNPIWTGGGVALGPTGNENYNRKLTLATKRQAIRQALSIAAKEDKVKVIEAFEPKDGKVGSTVKLLDKLGATGSVLIVVSTKNELIERATRNIPKVNTVSANYLNVYDALNADTIIVSQESLEIISNWLGGKK